MTKKKMLFNSSRMIVPVWGHVSDFLKLIHILLGYFSYNVYKIRISFLKMLTFLVINLVNAFKIMNGYGEGGGWKTCLCLQIQLEKSNLLVQCDKQFSNYRLRSMHFILFIRKLRGK